MLAGDSLQSCTHLAVSLWVGLSLPTAEDPTFATHCCQLKKKMYNEYKISATYSTDLQYFVIVLLSQDYNFTLTQARSITLQPREVRNDR